MPNNQLLNKTYIIPDKLILRLKQIYDLNSDSKKEKGFSRLKFLIKNGKITYQEMKRLKNYFDNYTNDKTDLEYELNGGDYMKTWVTTTLDQDRKKIENSKKTLSDSGLSNQYHKEHFQDNTKVHKLDGKTIRITESQFKKIII